MVKLFYLSGYEYNNIINPPENEVTTGLMLVATIV